MQHSEIWRDINTSVHRAIVEGLHREDETDLAERSDELLTGLPVVGGAQPTTALLLRRYHTQLHHELCQGSRPVTSAATVEDELREITRAVVATMGGEEGLPIDGAVLIALVLYKRGLPNFCAMPAVLQPEF